MSSLYDFIAKAHAAKSPQAVRRLKSKAGKAHPNPARARLKGAGPMWLRLYLAGVLLLWVGYLGYLGWLTLGWWR